MCENNYGVGEKKNIDKTNRSNFQVRENSIGHKCLTGLRARKISSAKISMFKCNLWYCVSVFGGFNT